MHETALDGIHQEKDSYLEVKITCLVLLLRESSTSEPDFDSVLLEVVEGTLTMVFGRPGVDAIFQLLEKRGIRREDIPRSFDGFCASLAALIGSGYSHLEKLMAKRLCLRLQEACDPEAEVKLVDLVNELRRRFRQ